MVFVFSSIGNGQYKITEVNTNSGVDKNLTIPTGGFALAINSYSALDKFRSSIRNNFTVGALVTLSGYTVS